MNLYPQRIDNLKIHADYQLLKLQQFEDKENLKYHVAHFIDTYNKVGIYVDYLVNQLV